LWLDGLNTLLQQASELAWRKKTYLENVQGKTRPALLAFKPANLDVLKQAAVDLAVAIAAALPKPRRNDRRVTQGRRYSAEALDRSSQIMKAIYGIDFSRDDLTAAIQKRA
jgi:hypothetical protein